MSSAVSVIIGSSSSESSDIDTRTIVGAIVDSPTPKLAGRVCGMLVLVGIGGGGWTSERCCGRGKVELLAVASGSSVPFNESTLLAPFTLVELACSLLGTTLDETSEFGALLSTAFFNSAPTVHGGRTGRSSELDFRCPLLTMLTGGRDGGAETSLISTAFMGVDRSD